MSGLDDLSTGALGALLGAVVGGILTLFGSFLVSSNQQKGQVEIKKKETIYQPLYDELKAINDDIFIRNPYPSFIEFRKGDQTIIPHPQYTVWGRVRLDIRFLETPRILTTQMEKLYLKINNYIEVRNAAHDEIRQIFNETLVAHGLPDCKIINLGDMILPDLFQNVDADIYDIVFSFDRKEIEADTKQSINTAIYKKCNNNMIITRIRERYEELLSVQKDTIDMLELLIKAVNKRYKS